MLPQKRRPPLIPLSVPFAPIPVRPQRPRRSRLWLHHSLFRTQRFCRCLSLPSPVAPIPVRPQCPRRSRFWLPFPSCPRRSHPWLLSLSPFAPTLVRQYFQYFSSSFKKSPQKFGSNIPNPYLCTHNL